MPERDLYEEIARVAYELWEKNGYIHGQDIEHWCQAEQIVISRTQVILEEKPKKTRAPRKTSTKTTAKEKPKKATATTKKAATKKD